jgi:hypothetical protein
MGADEEDLVRWLVWIDKKWAARWKDVVAKR